MAIIVSVTLALTFSINQSHMLCQGGWYIFNPQRMPSEDYSSLSIGVCVCVRVSVRLCSAVHQVS